MIKKYENLIKKIDKWIEDNKDLMIDDLKKIVKIESISDMSSDIKPFGGPCRDVIDKMLKMGMDNGFDVINHEYYCGEIVYNLNSESSIGLWAHLDIVPPGNGWKQVNPFECEINDGYITGRGVRDDKGAAIIGLYTMKCIRDLNIDIDSNVRLIVGCDEECGMRDADYFLSKNLLPTFSLIMDTDFPVCYAENGIFSAELISNREISKNIIKFIGGNASNMVADSAEIIINDVSGEISQEVNKRKHLWPDGLDCEVSNENFKIIVRGKSAHAANPEGSVNAIQIICKFLIDMGIVDDKDIKIINFISHILDDYYGKNLGIQYEDKEMGKLTFIGGKVNIKDRKLVLDINIRYPVCADSEDIIKKINEVADENAMTVNILEDSRPFYKSKDDLFVRALSDIYNQFTGNEHKPYIMGGGTYARKIPNAIAFGPDMPNVSDEVSKIFGKGHGNIHQPNETAKISDMLMAIKIYIFSIINISLKLRNKHIS